MHIDHVGLWTNHLEPMKAFYEKYFQAITSSKYQNTAKKFESYFLTFASGARLELMSFIDTPAADHAHGELLKGYAHVAYACGSERGVTELTERIHQDGYRLVESPRHTGDGYFESVILDPDGNRIELTV
jgi:lactoylglutathione lyase